MMLGHPKACNPSYVGFNGSAQSNYKTLVRLLNVKMSGYSPDTQTHCQRRTASGKREFQMTQP
jgi:hypothetical protein